MEVRCSLQLFSKTDAQSCQPIKIMNSSKTIKTKWLVSSQLFPNSLPTYTNGTNFSWPKMLPLQKKSSQSHTWKQPMIIQSLKSSLMPQKILNPRKEKRKKLPRKTSQVLKRTLNQTLSINFTHFLAAEKDQKGLSRRQSKLQYPAQNSNRKFCYCFITLSKP